MRNGALVIATLLITVLQLIADVPTASVTGAVTDSTGAALAGALVTATNIGTNVSRSATTNASGVYQLLGLQAGRYEISASRPQFATVKRTDVTLQVADDIRLDLTLAVGEGREVLVVTETPALTETETSESTVVNQQAISELPSDGRQFKIWRSLRRESMPAGSIPAANRYGKARENTEGAFSVAAPEADRITIWSMACR